MAAHWPNEPDDNPIAASLNATPKYVATRSLRELEWANSHILGVDIVAEIQNLKAEGEGFITMLGSGDLVQSLLALDLVDVFRIFIHPLVSGTGRRSFRDTDRPIRLRLTDCTPTTTGVLLCTYERELEPTEYPTHLGCAVRFGRGRMPRQCGLCLAPNRSGFSVPCRNYDV